LVFFGGFKHDFDFPLHKWDVIFFPLTNSMIFQDGDCTTNQLCFLGVDIPRKKTCLNRLSIYTSTSEVSLVTMVTSYGW
jgi:hypothetical protein